jgi:hypothetical protein
VERRARGALDIGTIVTNREDTRVFSTLDPADGSIQAAQFGNIVDGGGLL